MFKKFIFKSITVIVFGGCILNAGFCFAQEQITITTYYPSPYGIYRELRTDFLAVGSAYRITPAYSDGYLMVANRVGIALGAVVPAHALDVGGNINVRGTQVLMANSANHYYGDGTNLAVRMSGDFYVQNVAGTLPRDIMTGDVWLGAPRSGPARWASTGPCVRRTFTIDSGDTPCPAGTSIAMGPITPAQTSGMFLCCTFS